MKPSNLKDHIDKASNMSFSDIVKGSSRLVGNTISLGFKAIGATVYVAEKAIGAGLQAAYNETKKGYNQTDNLVTQAKREPKREPTQMELDLE